MFLWCPAAPTASVAGGLQRGSGQSAALTAGEVGQTWGACLNDLIRDIERLTLLDEFLLRQRSGEKSPGETLSAAVRDFLCSTPLNE